MLSAPASSACIPPPIAGLGASAASATFAPAQYRVRVSDDVDEHAGHLSAWQQQYDQLSGGRFSGRVRELWMDGPRLQVFHEHTSGQTSQQCAPWSGSVWFGLADRHCREPLHFCGQAQRTDQGHALLRARASEGFELRTPPDFGIYGVVLDQAWLQAQVDAEGLGDAVCDLSQPAQARALSPAQHVALCDTLEQLLQLGHSDELDQPWGRLALQAGLERLLHLLCGARADDPARPRPPAAQRRFALVMAARELARQPSHQALGVDELCQRLHLTRRTLQNHFQSVLGESPAEFLKAVRLNACRRALRACEPGDAVQDVAARWGFSHMGHFSQDYKALFGELPSETRRRRTG